MVHRLGSLSRAGAIARDEQAHAVQGLRRWIVSMLSPLPYRNAWPA